MKYLKFGALMNLTKKSQKNKNYAFL